MSQIDTVTTKELLLIRRYSELVDKLTIENRELQELLIKSKDNYTLMYNSRERYKAMYAGLLSRVQSLINTAKSLGIEL